jgi:hypothetical protein
MSCVVATLAILLCTATLRAADNPARLPSIPDIGEPFDVKSFIAVPFSYRNNAFTLYRHADSSYATPPNAVKTPKQPGARFNWIAYNKSLGDTLEKGWAHANADVRRWLQANEFALQIWHRGTQCAEAIDVSPADIRIMSGPTHITGLREFARLACLKAARMSAEGKVADAWKWQLATLRSSAHVAMHTGLLGRLVGMAIYGLAADQARLWAARREVAASDLRLALTDVLAVNKLIPATSKAIKGDYLSWRRPSDRNAGLEYTMPRLGPLLELVGYEERARRTLNIVYANLLSQVDRPRFRRTPLPGTLPLFGRGASAPLNAKVYSDEDIEGKILTFPPDFKIAELLLPPKSIFDALDSERANQAALVLILALQLHHREHGQFPATLAELVKNGYVQSIPPDPFGKGEPFHYRRENDPHQGAVLWSVWWDGIDQQGRRDVWNAADRRTGDRIFKIEGR